MTSYAKNASIGWADSDPESREIQRRQFLADKLIEKSQKPAQGQMIGDRYVAPSWTQMLADGLSGYVGGEIGRQNDEKYANMQKVNSARMASALKQFGTDIEGTPAQTIPADENPWTSTPEQQIPAVAGNMGKAYRGLTESGLPGLQSMGMTGTIENAKTQAARAQQIAMAKALQAAPDAQTAIAQGIDPKMVKEYFEAPTYGVGKKIAVNGQLVDELTGKPVGTAIAKQADADSPNKPFHADGTPNLAYQDYEKTRAKLGASNVTNKVSVAGPENKYNAVVGEGLGKTGLEAVDAAKNAPEVIRNAQMVRQAIQNGAVSGTGADARYAITKALETAGIVGPGKAENTEAVMSGLSKITLAGVKTSGLGGGTGFSNADRDFLEKAAGGKISDTPANLLRVADLSERIATANHQKGAKVLDRWKNDPALKNVAQDTQLDPIPSAPAAKGTPAFADPAKQSRYEAWKAAQPK